jgi:hypothetical protein
VREKQYSFTKGSIADKFKRTGPCIENKEEESLLPMVATRSSVLNASSVCFLSSNKRVQASELAGP